MLAELAAANAAFEVVKQAVQNGKEIYEAGEALAQYFGFKSELQKRAHKHGHKSDLEAFMATEQLAAKEIELKEMMIYQGRGGMWEDWLKFQSDIKRSREEEERQIKIARQRRNQFILDCFMYVLYGVVGLIVTGCVIMITIAVMKYI